MYTLHYIPYLLYTYNILINPLSLNLIGTERIIEIKLRMCKESVKCNICTRKCFARKDPLHCSLCNEIFHPKCVNLAPNDVSQMKKMNILKNWYCTICTTETFPFMHVKNQYVNCNQSQTDTKSKKETSRINCKTCGKTGNKSTMIICSLCDVYSHARCTAGDLGFKNCMRELQLSSYSSHTVLS